MPNRNGFGEGRKNYANQPTRAEPSTSATGPFIEADDGALIVRMSPRHLKKLAREGKIPAHPSGEGQRRHWLFLASELHAWMLSKVNSTCDPGREPRRRQ